MSEEVRKRFEEFAKRMESDEDIFKLIDEMNTYMEGISDSTDNPYTKSELSRLMMDFGLIRVLLTGFKATGESLEKIRADLNSALERISKLEQKKPLDDPESLK
ncbi:MAG: hypothetical protein NPMRTHETA2_2120011 [Nitrosopumilales archaeon]|nr:MAG: hypothetical protein NPMRTHETA2_2120011 [Nitrosopumilales archaeon]